MIQNKVKLQVDMIQKKIAITCILYNMKLRHFHFDHLYGVWDNHNPHSVQVKAGQVEHSSGVLEDFSDSIRLILHLIG